MSFNILLLGKNKAVLGMPQLQEYNLRINQCIITAPVVLTACLRGSIHQVRVYAFGRLRVWYILKHQLRGEVRQYIDYIAHLNRIDSYHRLKEHTILYVFRAPRHDSLVLLNQYETNNTIYRQAFNKLKKQLVSTPLLIYFNLEQPLILETNTLNSIITSIYSQKQIDREQYPITYYLKTIVDTKLNYLIYNKEILAIISSFQHQQVQLEGTPEPI